LGKASCDYSGDMNTLEKILLEKKKKLLTLKILEENIHYPNNKNLTIWLKGALNIHSVRFRYAIKMSIILTLGVFLAREYSSFYSYNVCQPELNH